MIASYIVFYMVFAIISAQLILAVYVFPKIVEFFEDLYWDYIHRSISIPYFDTVNRSKQYDHLQIPKTSILILKADRFERKMANQAKKLDAVNYNIRIDNKEEEIIREVRKIRQMAAADEDVVKKLSFKAWIAERLVKRETVNGKQVAKLRRVL